MKERRVPFSVWFNHDGTNVLTCVSPWHEKGEPFSEGILRASIDELAGIGIDAVAFNPGNGAVPWWQSKVYPDHWEWFTRRTGKQPGSYGRYIVDGGDMVKVFVEQCRKHDLAPVITLRLKDEHAMHNLDSDGVSKFYYEHQRWRLDPRPGAIMGFRGLNWIFPEVVEERLGLLTELAEDYDIDGLELDFMRFYPFFKVDETGYIQRRDVMTGFIQSVRELLDRTAKKGQRRYLSIRVPNRIKEYDGLGIDLGLLDRERSVDIINVSPSYVSQVESDVSLMRAWAPNTAIFYEMTHCCARGPSASWGMYGDDYPARFTTDQQYYTMANLAYARGADGVSVFNFVYTRPYGRHAIEGNFQEPPFHIFKSLRDRDLLADQPQHYWIPYWWKTGYNGRQFQLPKTFTVDTEHILELDLELPSSGVERARLRVMSAGGTPVLGATEPLANVRGTPGLEWKLWLNGCELSPDEDVSEPFEDPYRGFLGAPEQYAAWQVAPEALNNGLNQIKVRLVGGPISEEFKISLIFADLAIWPKGK